MKLSIIVPIYKVEPYLHRCVDSILAQTFTDYELILVDDGSPDGCPKICDDYALKDHRIKVIHKQNGGLSDARNAGLDIAQGDYIGFVDSDDYISERMYQQLIEIAEKQNADIVACGMLQVDQNGVVVGRWPSLDKDKIYYREDFINDFYPDVRRDIMPAAWNKVYRRALFDKVRFPKGKIYEDSFVQLLLFDQCRTIAVSHEHFYNYFYNRGNSILNQKYTKKQFQLMEFSYEQYRFFVDKDIPIQQGYALKTYLNHYMLNCFAVYLSHKDLKKDFRPYRERFNKHLTKVLRTPQICKLKKITVLLMYINKPLAHRLCQKYFPECLPESLQPK